MIVDKFKRKMLDYYQVEYHETKFWTYSGKKDRFLINSSGLIAYL